MIEEAQKEGIKITCDRYPYTAVSTDLDTLLPSWAYEGGVEEELKRLKSLRVQEKIKRELLEAYPSRDYWDKVYIPSVLKILIEERLRVSAIFSTMNEYNLRRFLSLPYAMISTDSSARCTGGPTHKGRLHPRGFGSFPRFLGRYVRDNGLVSMSEAIHRITMLPAKTSGINKRGIIKKGAFADVVVFDHEKIIDRATFDEPLNVAFGGTLYQDIDSVLSNGVTVEINHRKDYHIVVITENRFLKKGKFSVNSTHHQSASLQTCLIHL